MSTGLILTIVLVPIALFVICGFLAALFFGSVISDQRQAKKDVNLTSCSRDTFTMRAGIRVVNSGDRPASYHVTVSFESADGTRLGTGSAYIRDLGPGKAAVEDAVSFGGGDSSPAKCIVTDVTRL